MIELMFWPFIATLVITGLHVYFGIHVIKREVIFVDLALAQLAALGALIAFVAGFGIEGVGAYAFSLLFVFTGALLFSFTRFKKGNSINQEAVIGIVYVFSAALAVIVLSNAPSEAKHIKYMLVGNILFVKPIEVLKMLLIYTGIGAFHLIFRQKFLLISKKDERDENKGMNVKLWDFLFYATFGVMVTLSVKIAGVLLVFSYLIVPAVCSMLLAKSFIKRLIWGWGFGILASIAGLYSSAKYDFPTGAAIVCCFGVLVALTGLIKFAYDKRR